MFDKFRIYLRALELEDYKVTFKWRQDPDIQDRYSDKRVFVSSENEKKWIENIINDFSQIAVGICLKENDELIGLAFLNDIDMHNRTGRSSSLIGEKKYRGQGLGAQVGMLLLYHAFFDRGFNRVWATILTDNIGSIKMHEKTGFKKEGIFRQSRFKNGKFVDEYYYAVLKDDFIKILENYNE